MTHPLEGAAFRFNNFKSFGSKGAFLSFAPISMLVGRNNSGKSAVIDAVEAVLTRGQTAQEHHNRFGEDLSIELKSIPSEMAYRRAFRQDMRSSGVLTGSDWDYGQRFVGQEVTRSYDGGWRPTWLDGPEFKGVESSAREKYQNELVRAAELPKGRLFRVAAERNVLPEIEGAPSPVEPSGKGLTNLVRAFLYEASLPMHAVESDLLHDLNYIYKGDAYFTRILARRLASSEWEIFLEERAGKPIRLSESGSSLKSIFIILAILRLNPIVDENATLQENVFCVEEPENNLHPSLLRRLLEFLARRRAEANSTLLVTTHSSAAIDWATRRDDAATYHVRRGEQGSLISEAKEYLSVRELLQDLDIRASELLQANGVIWVEGP